MTDKIQVSSVAPFPHSDLPHTLSLTSSILTLRHRVIRIIAGPLIFLTFYLCGNGWFFREIWSMVFIQNRRFLSKIAE